MSDFVHQSFAGSFYNPRFIEGNSDKKAFISFSVRIQERRFNREQNTWEKGDSWFKSCIAFGRIAEHIDKSCRNGDRVIVSGNARKKREYTDKNGVKHDNEEQIIVDEIGLSLFFAPAHSDGKVFAPRHDDNGNGQSSPQQPSQGGQSRTQQRPSMSHDAWQDEPDPFSSGDDEVAF